jgi:2-(3-amino-3-carboxypropyl)histidine synthase
MKKKSLQDLQENYEIEKELVKAIGVIKKQKSRKVLLQFPDGLKPYATEIQKELETRLGKQSKIEFFIWLDSCFGACDLPLETEKLGIDLIIQFGHSTWDYSSKKEYGIKEVK